jgi:cell division transport system permease protein
MRVDPQSLQSMDNPLSDRIDVRARNPQDLPALAGLAETLPEVKKVVSRMQTTKRVLQIARVIRTGSLIAVILVCLAGILIVHNTIRLTIFARRREIGVMQVVGATNFFVSGPYLLEGMALGLAGALVAAGMVLGGYYYLLGRAGESLQFVPLVSDPSILARFALALLVAGIVLGLIGSLVSVSRFLKRLPA